VLLYRVPATKQRIPLNSNNLSYYQQLYQECLKIKEISWVASSGPSTPSIHIRSLMSRKVRENSQSVTVDFIGADMVENRYLNGNLMLDFVIYIDYNPLIRREYRLIEDKLNLQPIQFLKKRNHTHQ
ncbi:hypothetical protein N7495_004644, partial [Penicillium taxi]|uniref:uncharacterized protein n=1 Tax=Penicillium taxi TaxID=168475 RepID=UPI002545A9F6